MNSTVKKGLWATAIAGGTTLWLDYLRDTSFGTTAAETVGVTDWVVNLVNGVIEKWANLVENVPLIWEAAPFAFPVIAGLKWWNMLANKLFHEDSKMLKRLTTIAGWVVGWVAATTVASPYLTVAGLGYAAWKSPKILEWIARKGVAFPVQGAKWIGDGWKRWKNAATAKDWSKWEKWVFA